MFTCIRQRRKGKAERDAYNAKIEKERQEAYQDQMELREKGLGGWDKGAYERQGADALGGWQESRGGQAGGAAMPKAFSNVSINEVPSRHASPAPQGGPLLHHSHSQHGAGWNGGNAGGMIHGVHNAYNGGYHNSPNIPRSPSFPLTGGGLHHQHQGYQRF